MELPKRLSPPEGCAWNEDSPHFKINEILSYLESQKQNETSDYFKHDHGFSIVGTELVPAKEEPKECKHGKAYICAECNDKFSPVKEEPKQIDVDVMLFEYTTLHAQPDWTRKDYQRMQEIINTLKQALQQ